MKLLKRITAVIATFLIAVNIAVVNISAAMAAPVFAGGELGSFLAGALGAAGHSQSEIDSLSISDQLDLFGNDLKNGNLSLDTPVTVEVDIDGVNQVFSEPLEVYMGLSKDVPFYNPFIFAVNWYKEGVNNFIGDIISVVDGSVELDERYLIVTSSTIDMQGFGAVIIFPDGDIDYCQYVIRNVDDINGQITEIGHRKRVTSYGSSSTYSNSVTFGSNTSTWKYYGDIRWSDGTSAPTDDELEYVLGEVDGTKVTPDILNPDGSVTIDGVTYYPADYLDPDALSEEGKNQLINNITNVINNTYVISEDKPIVDEDDITVEVAEELENYTVPTGIITVFPFCLPWDFVRGMKSLVQKPKAPVFKAELDLTDFCGYDLGKHTIEISFEKWEPAVNIFRWFSILLFIYALILITPKICKGAG